MHAFCRRAVKRGRRFIVIIMEERMRKHIGRALALAAVFAILLSFSAAQALRADDGKKPVIHIEERIVDVGLIYEEKDVEYDFVVENRGNAELHILRIKAG